MRENLTVKDLGEILDVARDVKRGELLLKNARVVNVFNETVEKADVVVHKGIIAGVGDYSEADEVVDLKGAYLAPGFMDAHVHIESSMSIPSEFARAVLPRGTTAVMADPHEIANVAGIRGIKFMLENSRYLPLDIYIMLSSCVPATSMDSSGERLLSSDLVALKEYPGVLGLAEMMNFPGLLAKDPDVLEKVLMFREKVVDGHAPGLTGKQLNAYLSAGIMADHECTVPEEVLEKISRGMWIMLREGSVTRDVERLVPVIKDNTKHRLMFCTDDRHPEDLIKEGHVNYAINLAVKNGVPLPTAVRLATLNPACFFGLKHRGAVAPGYTADLVVFEELTGMQRVYKDGKLVAMEGRVLFDPRDPEDGWIKNTVNIKPLMKADLKVRAGKGKIRVMGIRRDSIITDTLLMEPEVRGDEVVSDTGRDIIKIAVIERHHATGRVGLGFINGLGLKKGAFATTISHDSHNIIVAGENDADMLLAVEKIKKMGGGIAVTAENRVLGSLPLPYGGLMTDAPIGETARTLQDLHQIARQQNGVKVPDPFMTLAFMSLAVCPELKITDRGQVDVREFKIVDLFEE